MFQDSEISFFNLHRVRLCNLVILSQSIYVVTITQKTCGIIFGVKVGLHWFSTHRKSRKVSIMLLVNLHFLWGTQLIRWSEISTHARVMLTARVPCMRVKLKNCCRLHYMCSIMYFFLYTFLVNWTPVCVGCVTTWQCLSKSHVFILFKCILTHVKKFFNQNVLIIV